MASAATGREFPPVEREKLWLCLIILVGAVLRLYRLEYQSLWNDEGLQYFTASAENFASVLDRTRWRTWHPPFSFFIHHLFLLAGNSDFFLRLPSALFGIGSLPLCYVLIKRLASVPTAIFAVLVLAMSPFHIWYSQEGRMYAQLLFFFLLSSIMLLQALERGRWQWWVFYALAVAAGMFTHVMMAFGVLANVLWLLLFHRRQLFPLIASGALVALLFLPWVYSSRAVKGFINNPVPMIVPGSVQSGFSLAVLPYTFYTFATGFSLGPTVAELHENRSLGFILQFLPLLLAVGIIFGSLLLIGTWALYRRYGIKCLVFCLLGLIAPVGGAVLFSLMPRGLFNVRYTILAVPYFCVFVGGALAFASRKSKLVGIVAVVAVVSISSASLFNHFSNPRYAKEDVKSAVASWRSIAPQGYLLSAVPGGVRDAINKYVAELERGQHIAMGLTNTVSKTHEFFATYSVPSVYILLARDWHQAKERAIRSGFTVIDERAYPGVKLLRIRVARPERNEGSVER